jgi:hypothetical protein
LRPCWLFSNNSQRTATEQPANSQEQAVQFLLCSTLRKSGVDTRKGAVDPTLPPSAVMLNQGRPPLNGDARAPLSFEGLFDRLPS